MESYFSDQGLKLGPAVKAQVLSTEQPGGQPGNSLLCFFFFFKDYFSEQF